jgi:hypothetical protein
MMLGMDVKEAIQIGDAAASGHYRLISVYA